MKIKDLTKRKKEIIFNKSLLKKPYSQYFKIGEISENLFMNYCTNNGLNIIKMGEFSYRLLLYGRYVTLKKPPYYNQYEKSNFKNKKINEFMKMFTKEQIKFLEENHQTLDYGTNQKKTGLPDFFMWDNLNNFAFVELKAGTSVLNKKQREVFKRLTELFPVYICHVNMDVEIVDLNIKNIDLGFISIKDKFKFDLGGLVEQSLYKESHKE